MKPIYYNRSDRVWYVMKTRQDSNMTNCIGLIYAKTKIEL